MNARMIVGMLLLLGILGPYALPAQESGGEVVHPTDVGVVSSICGTSFGTRFNLEPRPNAQAQFGQAIDVLPNRVASGVDLVVGGSANSFAGVTQER
jgi:hypothetical protein